MPLYKKKFPDQSHKQVDLVKQHLGISYDAHNAEGDVEVLGKMLTLCDETERLAFSFPPVAMKHSVQFETAKSSNIS